MIATRDTWEPRTRQAILLSLDEALSNIIMYAFESTQLARDSAQIRIECWSSAQRIRLDVIDNGIPFDPTRITPPALSNDLDAIQIGGHGMRLIRHYMSNIEYTYDGRCNRLSLIMERLSMGSG